MRRIWTGMGSKGIAYEENMDGIICCNVASRLPLFQVTGLDLDWCPNPSAYFYFYFYFFLPLVPIGVAGGHSCLSAARWVAWRRDIP